MPTITDLQSTHSATIAALSRAITGGKLSAAETQDASDFLAGLSGVIAADSHVVYRIEDHTRAVRLRDGRDPTQLRDGE